MIFTWNMRKFLFLFAALSQPANAESSSAILILDIHALVSPDSTLPERQSVAKQIADACEQIGFFVIVNHGIPESTVSELLTASADFFDMTMEDKLLAKTSNEKEYPYGYEQSEVLSRGKATEKEQICEDEFCDSNPDVDAEASPDLKETYAIGPRTHPNGTIWRRYPPKSPDNFEQTHDNYYAALEELAQRMLQGFALALDLPEHWFESYFDRHQCALRTLNYPQMQNGSAKQGQIRAGAHTDYGAFTILKTGGPGLQVKKDRDDNDGTEWVAVPDIPNSFVVNVADMMRRWTNDRWASTLHRVVVPENKAHDAAADRRQSVAFFVNANEDALVGPIPTCVDEAHPAKYAPVKAGEYLMMKHLASMGDQESA